MKCGIGRFIVNTIAIQCPCHEDDNKRVKKGNLIWFHGVPIENISSSLS